MRLLTATLFILLSHAALAADDPVIAEGKKLHDQSCLKCHNTNVYTRKDRNIKTLAALKHQVSNCMKGPANVHWNEQETAAVVKYLNTEFYKF